MDCIVHGGHKKSYRTKGFHLGFPCGKAGKESVCNVGDLGLIPGLGRSPGEGKGHPLQYSGLENSMEWIVLGAAKSWTRLSNFHFQIIINAIAFNSTLSLYNV